MCKYILILHLKSRGKTYQGIECGKIVFFIITQFSTKNGQKIFFKTSKGRCHFTGNLIKAAAVITSIGSCAKNFK